MYFFPIGATLRNRRFLRPITPFSSPSNSDQHTDIPLTQPSHADQAARVQPDGTVFDQPAQLEDNDEQHSYDTVQPLPPYQVPPSRAPATPVLTPVPPATPEQSPVTSITTSSEPVVRRSGRTRVMNTRLVGYELGSLTLCKRELMGGGR